MLQLPIGYDIFGELVKREIFFVDKTLLIQELLDRDTTQVTLITRPRRFGKTLNLSMLQYFFAAEAYGEKTKGLFDNLKIAKAGAKYMEHQGKYPVIFISLKDVKNDKFAHAYACLKKLISDLYLEHYYLLDNNKLNTTEKNTFNNIANQQATREELETSLKTLCGYLLKHFGVKPWLFVDEYDTPLQSAYLHGYYEEMISFMRGMFGAALKTNPYLYRSVITGILRIAKESLFSGLNNLEVYSVLREEYSQYFGFTENEIKDLLIAAKLEDKSDEIRNWYNGYKFGTTTIYNPWSIAHFINRNGLAEPYWVNTSDNKLIRDLIVTSPEEFKKQIEQLLNNQPIESLISEDMVFGDLQNRNDIAVWSLMFMSGYLKILERNSSRQGMFCKLDIPNYEVRILYQQIIEYWLTGGNQLLLYNKILANLLDGNIEKFIEHFTYFMERTISYHDFDNNPEAFYHGLLIGLTASLYGNKNYEIISNRESGYGRYDYLIFSHDQNKPTIILELKRAKKPKTELNDEDLAALLDKTAAEALNQIEVQNYAAEAKNRGRTNILKIGWAFSGKEFRIKTA